MAKYFKKAYLLLFVLLIVKGLLIFSAPIADTLNGDAYDYVGKATHLLDRGTFKPVTPPVLPKDISGHYSDFRPPGFPVIVSALMWVGGHSPSEVNLSARVLNFILDVSTSTLLLYFALSVAVGKLASYLSAAIIGIQPWTSAFVTAVYPDTVVTFLVVSGIAFLTLYVHAVSRRREVLAILISSAVLSSGALIRPELIIAPPVLVGVAILLRWRRGAILSSLSLISFVALVPFILSLSLNAGYRWTVEHKLAVYGEFQHQTPGLSKWTMTWIGSGKIKEDIMWGPFQIAQSEFEGLPDRTFSSPQEKQALAAIARDSRDRGYMTKAEDDLFYEIADMRIKKSPMTYWVFGRLYNSIHFWINMGSASYLLYHQSKLPDFVSKLVTGVVLVFKLSLLMFSIYGFYLAVRRSLFVVGSVANNVPAAHYFLVMGCVFFLMRTFIFGLYISFVEYRYSIPAWPFVISAAVLGIVTLLQSPGASFASMRGVSARGVSG